MRRRKWLLFVFALTLLSIAGPNALGRVALLAGFPRLSLPLLSNPASRGLALFRSGDFTAADAAFARAGSRQTFNRGLALAASGRYADSLAYFDAVLFANPADAEARRLHDRVSTMVEPVRGDSVAPGRLAGHGSLLPPPGAIYSRAGLPDPEWQKPVEARGFVANDDWLGSIGDDPGEFLRLRLKAEYEHRSNLGTLQPALGDAW